MLQVGDKNHAARHRRTAQSGWHLLVDTKSTANREITRVASLQPAHNRLVFSSKFSISFAITVVIVLAQIFIVHHYIGLNTSNLFNSQESLLELGELSKSRSWICFSCPYLADVNKLARKFDVELVIIDPDLLQILYNKREGLDQNDEPVIVFSGASKVSQESEHKSVIHLAAINETSGGQPNLKLFYNALKHAGYVTLKYDDSSQTMPAEVYKRPPNMFDDMQLDAIKDRGVVMQDILSSIETKERPVVLQDDIEISKIYTEFISHIFILNNTSQRFDNEITRCYRGGILNTSPFIVINIFVLYNFEYKPNEQWIQPSLILDEVDKHKLLSYKVHSKDFRLPLDRYYIHSKKNTVSLSSADDKTNGIKRSLDGYKVFRSDEDRLLRYVNNSYIYCKASSFNVTGLIDNSRKMSNYLKTLDNAQPLKESQFRNNVVGQLIIALQFMDVFSKAYGNFSYWITGSSLLAYRKFCELAIVPPSEQLDKLALGEVDDEGAEYSTGSGVVINLELGLFANELNASMLEDLANAKMIGVTMMSDWRKPNALITFHIKDCPNVIFNIYLYELKRDFYQYYFITRNSMTMSHKLRRKTQLKDKSLLISNPLRGHHVFATANLELCWTRISHFHPFRVPCDVHDHLRRIYVV